MNQIDFTSTRTQESVLASNKVLKNTYMLLSATLAFSAVMAGISMFIAMPPMTYMVSVIVAMVLGIFVLPRTANSSAGIGVIFVITGLMG
ncbi:membrane protein, partial [Candidatus Endoriftia persephone str. Guaymas]|nr:membrane protein [Candidatus Endoriftia persephone str. Guaymas]